MSFMEEQKDILLERFALAVPELYENLKKSCGEEEGVKIFKKVTEEKFKKSYEKIKVLTIEQMMSGEEKSANIFEWELRLEEKTEDGEKVWYEYLGNCPHLKATRKYGMPPPCVPVCYNDFELLEKYGILKAEETAHILKGADMCCFRIRRK